MNSTTSQREKAGGERRTKETRKEDRDLRDGAHRVPLRGKEGGSRRDGADGGGTRRRKARARARASTLCDLPSRIAYARACICKRAAWGDERRPTEYTEHREKPENKNERKEREEGEGCQNGRTNGHGREGGVDSLSFSSFLPLRLSVSLISFLPLSLILITSSYERTTAADPPGSAAWFSGRATAHAVTLLPIAYRPRIYTARTPLMAPAGRYGTYTIRLRG